MSATTGLTGMKFRGFERQSDFPKMAKLIQEISKAEDGGYWTTAEDIERDYSHLINSTPETDMRMVENEQGDLIAYARVGWEVDDEKRQVFGFPFNIHPSRQNAQLYQQLLSWVETRVREVAVETNISDVRVLRAFLRNVEKDASFSQALTAHKFIPVRFMNRMIRDLNESIEVPPMPEGLEVRPMAESQYQAVFKALDEAFQDHWGHAPLQEEMIESFMANPNFKPALWQVAWDGHEVAAGILNTVDEAANEQFNLKRGMTDPTFTRRAWRKRGLARALLMRSLQMFKELGMTEAMLGVDTQNPSGAFTLYESCGFRSTQKSIVYEKSLSA
jgi:mycothiol synthase